MKPFDRPITITSDREKLLIVGSSGTKKTSACIQLAIQYPDVGVAIIDPDDGVSRVVNDYGGFPAIPNLIHLPAPTWGHIASQYKFIKPNLEPGDWLCLDMVGQFYQSARDFYTISKYHMSLGELMESRKQADKKLMGEGLGADDWQVIIAMHDSVVQDAIRHLPCNILLTAGAKPIIFAERNVPGGNGRETAPLYSTPEKWVSRKFMPEMEKHVDYAVSTILYLSSRDIPIGRDVDVEFTFETVGKDRGRRAIPRTPWNMLWLDYCTAVGLDSYLNKSPGAP